MDNYILKHRKPILCNDWVKYSSRFEITERRIRVTYLGKVKISTVFLCWDHSFAGDIAPVLFETMIFGIDNNEYQTRCATHRQALAMHWEAVRYAKSHS